jgi:hypothetical protein
MPLTIQLPIYMRIGDHGKERCVGHATVDLATGEVTSDLGRLEEEAPDMLQRSVDAATGEGEDAPDAPA